MPKYRVWIQVPGAEKPIQLFLMTKNAAEDSLKQVLEGKPKGTAWTIYQTVETVTATGVK